jgi:hypothetical protein
MKAQGDEGRCTCEEKCATRVGARRRADLSGRSERSDTYAVGSCRFWVQTSRRWMRLIFAEDAVFGFLLGFCLVADSDENKTVVFVGVRYKHVIIYPRNVIPR